MIDLRELSPVQAAALACLAPDQGDGGAALGDIAADVLDFSHNRQHDYNYIRGLLRDLKQAGFIFHRLDRNRKKLDKRLWFICAENWQMIKMFLNGRDDLDQICFGKFRRPE